MSELDLSSSQLLEKDKSTIQEQIMEEPRERVEAFKTLREEIFKRLDSIELEQRALTVLV